MGDPHLDYGEGKSRSDDAIDSAMMLATVVMLVVAVLAGVAIGVGFTLWLT